MGMKNVGNFNRLTRYQYMEASDPLFGALVKLPEGLSLEERTWWGLPGLLGGGGAAGKLEALDQIFRYRCL